MEKSIHFRYSSYLCQENGAIIATLPPQQGQTDDHPKREEDHGYEGSFVENPWPPSMIQVVGGS